MNRFPPQDFWILEEMADFRTGPRIVQDKPGNLEGPESLAFKDQ